jgi:hypothetical protein
MEPEPPDEDLAAVSLVDLAEPRPLTVPERALLDALVEPLAIPELTALAERAQVTAECACGCPSIGLWSEDGPELSAEAIAQLSDDPDRSIELTAYGLNDQDGELQVTLHIGLGRLVELEIWAGVWGADPRTTLPSVDTLQPDMRDR